jgi:hypothetical protein
MFFSGIGLLTLCIIRITKPQWVLDPGRLLANPADYVTVNYQIILRTFVMEELIALGAVVLHFLLAIGKPVVNISSWASVLANPEDKEHFALAKIRLTSGEEREGHVLWYSIALDRKNREIVLQPDMEKDEFVILSADSIESINISWSQISKKHSRVSYIDRVLNPVRKTLGDFIERHNL